MKRILAALALLGLAFVATADAQLVPFPQSLPPNSVIGRTGISAGPAQALPFSLLNSILVTPALNVMNFGCVGNGVADDTTCIQNAINSLSSSGGIVAVPVGNYKITSTINIGNGNSTPTVSTRNGIFLQGIGNPTALTCCGFPISSGPKLTWAGGTGVPMIKVQGPISGWGVQNLILDCGSATGSVGLQATAAVYGDSRNLTILDCAGQGIFTNSYPNFGSLHNSWRNVSVRVPAINTAIGVLLTGDGVGNTSNTAFDHYENLSVFLGAATVTGVYLQSADSNQFYNTHILGGGGGTVGVQFDYNATGVAGIFPAANVFYGIEPHNSTEYASAGTPGAGAQPNIIYGHLDANGSVIPNLPNLSVYASKKIVLSTGLGATNNTQIIPPTAPASPVTFNIPAATGTATIVASSPYIASGLLYGTGTSTLTNSDRCSMDSNSSFLCSSAAGPNWAITNSGNDANSASFLMQKNRAGGNTLNNDSLFLFLTRGFANGGQQNAAAIFATQSAASSGSNIPTKLSLQTSNTAGQLNQSWTFNEKGHMAITASAAPTLTAGCNGAGAAITGNNVHGTATGQTAAATTCTLTFANSGFTATPDCVVSGLTSPLTGAITPSTTTLVVNFASTANYKFTWHCFGL